MIVDTSALLCMFFAEARAPWVIEQLAASAGALRMSTVNLAETLIRVRDRQPAEFSRDLISAERLISIASNPGLVGRSYRRVIESWRRSSW